MKKWQANIGLFFTAMIWGGSFIATDNVLEYLNPLNIQIYRYFIASILLAALFFKKFIRVSKKTLLIGLLFGSLFLLSNTVQAVGLQYTTVSKNAFLTANYVIFIPLLTMVYLRRLPTKYVIMGIALMLIGYFLIIFEINVFDINSYKNLKGEMQLNKGDIITIVSAMLFALHIIAVNYFMKDEDPIQVLTYQLLFAALIGLIYALVTKHDFQFSQLNNFSKFAPSFIYLTFFSTILCFGGQLLFQKYSDSASAGILMSLESAFASIFAVLLGYDSFYSGLLVGGVFIISGIVCAETNLIFLQPKKDRT